MGQFIAFEAETDQRVIAAEGNLVSYYRFILEQAFSGLPLERIPTNFGTQYALSPKDGQSYNYYKGILGQQPRFYIPSNNHSFRDVRSVLGHIADQENKYYYAWVDSLANLVPIQVGNSRILDKLHRVNALVFYNINDEKKGNWKPYVADWGNQMEYFNNEDATIPIWIGSYEKQSGDGPQRYFGVFVDKGFPFFLDTNEEERFYKYKKENQQYESIFTERPGEKAEQLSKENLDYRKAWRRIYGLYIYRQSLANRKELGVNGTIKTRKLGAVLKSYSDNINGAQKQFLNNLTTGPNSQEEAALAFANNYAKLLPANYKCFYFRDTNSGELQGFLSSVNTGEGRRGSGGYAMRADKVSEVNYLWGYSEMRQEVQPIAYLLSHIMGLEVKFQVNSRPAQYYPTNWPVNSTVYKISNEVEDQTSSWFFYYKQFKTGEKRNRPPKPGPPRISGGQFQGYQHVFDQKNNGVELHNRSYRIWKKGNALDGIILGDGTNKDRAAAGSVMASALSPFTFYQLAEFSKSSLSATQFTGQMISRDSKIKSQWGKDNRQNYPALATDQEWCHLLGHGDGGPEELGNFVAGSKHCNTEQLAIEVGLRRITHNDELPSSIRKEFKAKITAYLFPNHGIWVDQKFTLKDLWTKFDITANDAKKETFDIWGPKFFQETSNNSGYYILNGETTAKSFEDLSNALRKSEGGKRSILFQFRQNLERHFFQYLPIGRWMRYKIYFKGRKLLDHIYDAQSQSFNLHEAQILDYTVERILYQALEKFEKRFQLKTEDTNEVLSYWQYYKRKISDRVATLVPNEEQLVKLNRRRSFFDFFLQEDVNKLLKTAEDLGKDFAKRSKNMASESVKAKQIIGDFRGYFEAVIADINISGVFTEELKEELRKAVNASDGLYKEILNQIRLESVYQDFRKTV